MVTRAEAYVDTSALIAFADRSDTHHPLFRRLFSEPPALLTSALVVAEGHGWFLRHYDPARGLQFLAMIETMAPLRVAAVDVEQTKTGTEMLRSFPDQRLTLVDAVGLHLMEERRLTSCWSTDSHLGSTGVPPSARRFSASGYLVAGLG